MYLHLYVSDYDDQQGAVNAISRSFNDEGRRSNSEIFDWELSEDDIYGQDQANSPAQVVRKRLLCFRTSAIQA